MRDVFKDYWHTFMSQKLDFILSQSLPVITCFEPNKVKRNKYMQALYTFPRLIHPTGHNHSI